MKFELDEEQTKKLSEWLDRKVKRILDNDINTGTIGGAFTYSFTPTGLGTVIKVKDATDNEELDLTDYDSW